MTKKVLIIFLLGVCLVLSLAFTPKQINPETDLRKLSDACSMQNTAFQVGEEIVYKLYYNWNFVWLPAGEVTFRVTDEFGQYHLSAEGRTYSSYEWFFKVRDYYDSYIDKTTMLPKVFIRDISEGKYTLYDEVEFDQTAHKAVAMRGKTFETTKRAEYDLDGCMHDMLSVVYYARNIAYDNFNAGQTFPVKIFMDKEVYPVQVKYKGKEARKKIRNNGYFDTIKFSPEVIAGEVFNEGTEMNIWVSDDANRIPLLIESPVSVGSVKAVLKSYQGLRHELSAKQN